MSNQNERNPYRNQAVERARSRTWDRARDEAPNEERNMWQARPEDGGWEQHRDDDWARNNGGANRFERGNERRYSDAAYGSSAGQARRGYGTEIYGESGLGEPSRGQTWNRGEAGRPDYERGGYEPSDYNRGIYRGSAYGGSGEHDPSLDYSHGFGPNHGFGYARNQPGSYRGNRPGSYGGDQLGNRESDSRSAASYSPTGLDRDRVSARGEQGYGRQFGGYAGRGPKDYKRADERIREDVCDRLSQDDDVDASEITVRVESGEVTLEGSVETRRQKHQAEEVAADVLGVSDVHNHVRVRKSMLSELKDKVTGDEQPSGGHAGSGTKTTSGAQLGAVDHNRH